MTTDLRSDTFTLPTPEMLDSMFKAKVGDDVFGEDPTINKLEAISADMFGMEAAIFCPSGTMTNQIAIKCHTQPGEEVICEKLSHVYIYEGGGIALNSGCQVNPIIGDRGRITADQVVENINPIHDYKAITRLVSIENTTNRGGGSCYDFENIVAIKDVCLQHKLSFHMDGARLWNAMVKKNESPKQYGEIFDSISICLSKGLGAPVGSLLLGNKAFIQKARRIRKVFGGGMRQAGYLAAAGIYALENNIARLKEDHEHAHEIGAALKKKSFIGNVLPIETNIVIFDVLAPYTTESFAALLETKQILVMPISSTQVRMVTHFGVTAAQVKQMINFINEI